MFTKCLSFSRNNNTKETGDNNLCNRKQGVSFTGIILTLNYTVFDKYMKIFKG